MRFLATFLAGRDPDREADCDIFAEKLLRVLTSLVTAKDKSIRTRCCQLVQVLFNGLTADELDEELLDSMEQKMMLRLEDKVPAVRAQAVKALPRLCNPGDVRLSICLCQSYYSMRVLVSKCCSICSIQLHRQGLAPSSCCHISKYNSSRTLFLRVAINTFHAGRADMRPIAEQCV